MDGDEEDTENEEGKVCDPSRASVSMSNVKAAVNDYEDVKPEAL